MYSSVRSILGMITASENIIISIAHTVTAMKPGTPQTDFLVDYLVLT